MKERTLGHFWGMRWVNKSKGIGYIQIQRNGSSTVVNNLRPNKEWKQFYSFYDLPEHKNIHYIAVIKDPWKRFMSGFRQVLRRRYISVVRSYTENPEGIIPGTRYYSFDTIYKKIFEDKIFANRRLPYPFREKPEIDNFIFYDEHTLPQSLVLSPFWGQYKVSFLHWSDTVMDELQDWLGVEFDIVSNYSPHIYPIHKEFDDHFEPVFQKLPGFMERWSEIFEMDYWLFTEHKVRHHPFYQKHMEWKGVDWKQVLL